MPSIVNSKNGSMEFISSNCRPAQCTERRGSILIWKSFGHTGNVNDINTSKRLYVKSVTDWDKWYADLPRDAKGRIRKTF
jgi:Neuraminidase (sialidase)